MSLDNIHIGTSGWSYKHWKETFYPKETKPVDYLTYYAKQFSTTEINTTFYSTPRLSTVENWRDKVPDTFRFSIKMNRYLTQIKRLKEPEEPLEKFFSAIEPVQSLCGMILLQLPPSLQFDYERADHLFSLLKKEYKQYQFALEVRHNSWLEVDSISLLTKYDIAFVISQSGNKFPYAEMITAKNIYVRFHGPDALHASSYSDAMLNDYAAKFVHWEKEGHIVWAYFNNDINGHAIANATALKSMIQSSILNRFSEPSATGQTRAESGCLTLCIRQSGKTQMRYKSACMTTMAKTSGNII